MTNIYIYILHEVTCHFRSTLSLGTGYTSKLPKTTFTHLRLRMWRYEYASWPTWMHQLLPWTEKSSAEKNHQNGSLLKDERIPTERFSGLEEPASLDREVERFSDRTSLSFPFLFAAARALADVYFNRRLMKPMSGHASAYLSSSFILETP